MDVSTNERGQVMRGFLIAIAVLVAVVIGLGFYLNWFTFGVDRAKIEADVKTVQKTFAGKSEERTGTIKVVEVAENRFTLATAGDPEMTVLMTDGSKVWRDKEAATFADLKAGDEVTVRFRDKSGKHEATSVTFVQK
jgi:Cu/Ag efflux protein CusF